MSDALTYRLGYALLLALLLAITLTHLGNASPYTYAWAVYGEARGVLIEGQAVNDDALSIVTLTTGFLKPCGLDYLAPNVFIPLHSLVVSSIVAFTHSYMLSHWLVNFASVAVLLAVVLRIGRESSLPAVAMVLAAASIVLLPWVAQYAGQPLQYSFGISLDCLLTIAVVRQSEKETPDPWLAGVSVALMSITYDWPVYAGGILVYLVAFRRFPRKRDYASFAATALAPWFLWTRFVHWAGGSQVNTRAQREFFEPFVHGWSQLLAHPFSQAMTFFTFGHVALDIMFKAVTGLVWWPLLVVVVFLVIWRRAPLLSSAWGQICASLSGVYVLEQLATAGVVPENNPRRAMPVVFAFSVALVWAIVASWPSRPRRGLFVVLAAMSGALVFADAACSDPLPALLEGREMVRTPPLQALWMKDVRLDLGPSTLLAKEGPLPLGKFAPACGEILDPEWKAQEQRLKWKLDIDPPDMSEVSPRRVLLEFGASQALLLLAVVAGAWAFVRARLLSTLGALSVVGGVVLSFVARLFY